MSSQEDADNPPKPLDEVELGAAVIDLYRADILQADGLTPARWAYLYGARLLATIAARDAQIRELAATREDHVLQRDYAALHKESLAQLKRIGELEVAARISPYACATCRLPVLENAPCPYCRARTAETELALLKVEREFVLEGQFKDPALLNVENEALREFVSPEPPFMDAGFACVTCGQLQNAHAPASTEAGTCEYELRVGCGKCTDPECHRVPCGEAVAVEGGRFCVAHEG